MEIDHNLPEDHNVQSCLGSSCLLNTTHYLDQIKRARNKLKVYDKREILYKVNKNKAWIDTLPNLSKIKTYMSQQERMLIPTNVSFENNSKQISLDNCLSGIESSIDIKEELTANSAENNMCIEENNLLQKDYDCLGCQKYFSDPYKAKRHILSDECKQEAYLCEQCGATFFSNEYYQRHKSSHLEKFFSFCKICNKTILVDTKSLPKKYSENNTNNCPHFSCEVCNKVYHSYASFRNHTRDHKRKSKAKLCEVCGKKTTFLHSHFVNHIKERKFKCVICLKTFLTDSRLQSHFMTHTGYRPVNCNICCNEFRSNNHLKRHQLLHTGGYTSKCNYCNYKFLQNSNLRLHLRTFACKPSSNEKPVFTCSHCGREFSKKIYSLTKCTPRNTQLDPETCLGYITEQPVQAPYRVNLFLTLSPTLGNSLPMTTTSACAR
uniref:C2H2-type domain-containing protein n=1 Tax=Timema cristinae TaxID=61476 RepID=A0A7R9H6X1_TIMCR|nr:unnamed protein product [Timema cristinae]